MLDLGPPTFPAIFDASEWCAILAKVFPDSLSPSLEIFGGVLRTDCIRSPKIQNGGCQLKEDGTHMVGVEIFLMLDHML